MQSRRCHEFDFWSRANEQPCDKNKNWHVHPAKTYISLGICPVWSWTAKTLISLGGCPGWSELRWAHLSVCWFCHKAAQMILLDSLPTDFYLLQWLALITTSMLYWFNFVNNRLMKGYEIISLHYSDQPVQAFICLSRKCKHKAITKLQRSACLFRSSTI